MFSPASLSNYALWVGFTLSLFNVSFPLLGQTPDSLQKGYSDMIEKERSEKDELFREDSLASPLRKEQREAFEGLSYFPIDSLYRVEATLERARKPKQVYLSVSTGSNRLYRKFGEAIFVIQGREFHLPIYQNPQQMLMPQYRNHLLIPFRDKTSGEETYGGGRYIDLRIPEGDHFVLDFNRAYNPYCAYGSGYACPIPPKENYLDIAIPVGEKIYSMHDE